MLMPFESRTVMEQKIEFVLMATTNNKLKFKELCSRYDISRPTGYKWVTRFRLEGIAGLEERSRKPQQSPLKSKKEIEEYIVDLRRSDPEWGPKKLHRIMQNRKIESIYPFDIIPCKNTIGKILERNGLIDIEKAEKSKPPLHFEYAEPNELWQMDFKGYFPMLNSKLCHPLAVLDDNSRFNIGLIACQNQMYLTVQQALIQVFKTYGLPERILSDNGSPWGTAGQETETGLRSISKLEKWLIRLNIKLIHGRAYHPQTQGKEERFNKTFKTEVLKYNNFKDIEHCQDYFNTWREKYNCLRPHEALGQDVPAKHYVPSARSYPDILPSVDYDSYVSVRKVMEHGVISFMGRKIKVGKAFIGDNVGVKPTNIDGKYEVYFCNQYIRDILLKNDY